jgi:hypothetical protein
MSVETLRLSLNFVETPCKLKKYFRGANLKKFLFKKGPFFKKRKIFTHIVYKHCPIRNTPTHHMDQILLDHN